MIERVVKRAELWAVALPIVSGAVATAAGAQVALPQLPSQSDISRERVPQSLPQTPEFDLRIQAPEKSAVPRSVDELQFQVREIKVEGAAHYPPAEVNALFAPLVGRTIALEDLREAAARLEARYRGDGYFLTRVFVPPQQVKGGVLIVRVVEGYVSTISVDAEDEGARRVLERLLRPLIGQRPTRLADIESRLLIINDMPGISGISVLRPSDDLGAAELVVTSRARPNRYHLTVSNSASDALGPWTFGASATLNRPFDRTGALDIAVSAGGRNMREVRSGSIRYAEPVGTSGLTASIGALAGIARPGGAIRALDVDSHVVSFSARLRYPLMRGRANSLFLDTGLSLNRTRTDALDTRIVTDRQTVGEVTLLWQQNGWLNGVTNMSVSLFHGLNMLGAMDRGARRPSVANFDPSFTKLSWMIQRSQALPNRFSAYAAVQGQYTRDTLLSGELITFGGPSIGRGYDPSLIAGDRGIGGIVELRYDPAFDLGQAVNNAQLYIFGDSARATTLANGTSPRFVEKVSSLGVGARFDLMQRIRVDAQLSDARRDLPGQSRRDPRFVISMGLSL